MSQNVEVVRQAVEANRSVDLTAGDGGGGAARLIALSDPSCEYTRVTAAVDPQTYRGYDGIRRYFSDMAESWQEWRLEEEEILEVGPDTVVATVRFHSIGRDSGVPVEVRLASVFVLSRGKLLRGRTFPSREEALDAAGFSE
jgi:ketosteroid isomerase-like protein